MGGTETTNIEQDVGRSIAVDASGNIYTVGTFQGTVDFDPSAGVNNMTSAGANDYYIQKLDPDNNLIWIRTIGGTSEEQGVSISIDNSDNIYVTGFFSGTVDFYPGAGTNNLTSGGVRDLFIQKWDISGNAIWAKSFGGSFGSETVTSISTDASGNIYTTGHFKGTIDFDPGAGLSNLTSNGLYDIFIQKLDASGNFLWAKNMGGTEDDYGRDITTDASGNVYTTGSFRSNITDFDPGAGIVNLTCDGPEDAFIQKLDANGNYIWARNVAEKGSAVTVDNNGDVYITGIFSNSLEDLDPDPALGAVFYLTGFIDVFILKLNTNGIFVWAKDVGGASNDFPADITTDLNGNIYTIGIFYGTGDYDPSVGAVNLTSNGSTDIFILKLAVNGDFIWVKQMGGTTRDEGRSIITDGERIYTTGLFRNTVDFNPESGVTNLTSAGGTDIFIQKFDQCITKYNTYFVTSCSNYTWIDGNTYASNNTTATHTVNTLSGCDSIITLNLTINQPSSFIDNRSACGSFIWVDGNVYTSNNNSATFTLNNNAGCDSIMILNLIINQASSSTHIVSECGGSYTWINGSTYTSNNTTATHTIVGGNSNGCDSVVTLNLTVNNSSNGTDLVTACGSYTWINGATYTSNNTTATHTIVGGNSNGCDSVVTLNLTINNSTNGTDVVTACGSYTWINGSTYTSNNITATHTIVGGNSNGCDSLVTLNLTVNNSTNGTDIVAACGPYTWINGSTYTSNNNTATHTVANGAANGCDSIVTLNLMINNSNGVDVVAVCGSYTWINGNSYTSNNTTATHTIVNGNANGCDSVVILNLTVNNSTNGIDVVTACGSYTWINGNSYTSSNTTATHTITGGNSNGCDSIVTLNLMVNNSTNGTDVITACGSFTWLDGNTYTSSNTTATHTIVNGAVNGCDSVITLNLIFNASVFGTDVVVSCSPYLWIDGNSYISNNTAALHTLVGGSIYGCDSIVTLNLTLNSVDISTTNNNNTITANATSASYQWLDCDNGNAIIPSETSQAFTPSVTGNYAVEITVGSCVDTSACENMVITSISEAGFGSSFTVYPNPTVGKVNIDLGKSYSNLTLKVMNVSGQLIDEKSYLSINKIEYDLKGSKGIYFIEITSENEGIKTLKLLKD